MKTIHFLILSILINSVTSAQYNLLVRGGINYSDFQGENIRNSDSKFSFSGCKPAFYCGLTYYKSKIQYVHFEVTCNLTTKRFSCDHKTDYRDYNHSFDGKFKLHLLDLSVYPVVGFGNDHRVSFSVRPNMGILVFSHFEGSSKYDSNKGSSGNEDKYGFVEEAQCFQLSFDLEYNLQFEYKHTDKVSYFYEVQFSHALLNYSFSESTRFKTFNYKLGAGIRYKIGDNTK
jgi:hypothetical protein